MPKVKPWVAFQRRVMEQSSKVMRRGRLWLNTRGYDKDKRIKYGLGPNGAADFIGFRSMVITEEHVGKRVAQFVAVEAKDGRGRASEEQLRFIQMVKDAGGAGSIIDNTNFDSVMKALEDYDG